MIRAAHYGETELRLTTDPIVVAMARGLADVPRDELAYEGPDGGPRGEFMQAANKEYRERGGQDGGHIGAVAAALLMILDSGDVKPTKVLTYYASRRSLNARSDEDAAMCAVDIVGGESDEKAARKALSDYMVDEARYLMKEGSSDRLKERAAKIALAAVGEVMTAKFEGGQPRETLNFEIDGLRFQLVRVEKPA